MGKDLKDEFLDELKNIKLEEKMYEKTSEINKFAFSEELKNGLGAEIKEKIKNPIVVKQTLFKKIKNFLKSLI